MPTFGATQGAMKPMSPEAPTPTSRSMPGASNGAESRDRGTPNWELKLLGERAMRASPSKWNRYSFTVVLPLEPVIPTTVPVMALRWWAANRRKAFQGSSTQSTEQASGNVGRLAAKGEFAERTSAAAPCSAAWTA